MTTVVAAELFISTAGNGEGLQSMTFGKVQSHLQKITKKLSADVVHKLSYRRDPNAADFDVEESAQDSLTAECSKMAEQPKTAQKQLECLTDLVTGLTTSATACDFKGSAAFFFPSVVHVPGE